MTGKNLTDKQYWDQGYKSLSFLPMPKDYPIIKEIYKHFPEAVNNEEVLELGCFPGRFLYHFGKLGYKLSGIDQTDYLEKMSEWFKTNNFKIGTFTKEDIFELNFDKKYDVVFSSGFIEHFTNFEEVIDIHTKLVKNSGHIFITVPNLAGALQKLLHTVFDKENIAKHFLPAMDPKMWQKFLEKNGFRIIDAGYIGGFDFWVGEQKRSLLQKILIKIIRLPLPMRWLPNVRAYSPEIFLIAQKI